MLRVGGPPESPIPPPDPTAGDPSDPNGGPPSGGPPPEDLLAALNNIVPDEGGSDVEGGDSQVSPQIAGYMGPEMGPFECEHCKFFIQPGSCKLVTGEIDPEGCCNLFTKASGDTATDETPDTDNDSAEMNMDNEGTEDESEPTPETKPVR